MSNNFLIEEREPYSQKKTIETTNQFHFTETTNPNMNYQEINTNFPNNIKINNNNNLNKNPEDQLPSSIYNDMASCSNYFNIMHEANINLKLENERLKKEIIEKNKLISQFENVANEAHCKFQQLEEMIRKRYDTLYNQMEQIAKIFDIPLNCDFVNNIQQSLCCSNNKINSLEHDNCIFNSQIQNLKCENEKLKSFTGKLEKEYNNHNCDFQMKENDYKNKICDLKNCLTLRENEINLLKNKICNLQNQICQIQNNNCEYQNRNMQNIIYSQ